MVNNLMVFKKKHLGLEKIGGLGLVTEWTCYITDPGKDLLSSKPKSWSCFYVFAKVPRPGDSEVTFAVFESSCHLLLPV